MINLKFAKTTTKDIAASVLQGYDLVAVRPTSEATFRYACQDADIDIIS